MMNVRSRLNALSTTLSSLLTAINTQISVREGSVATDLSGVPTAIQTIPNKIKSYIEGTMSTLEDSTISSIRANGLYYSTFNKLKLPNCTSIATNSVRQNASLTEVHMPKLTGCSNNAFQACSRLAKADIGQSAYISSSSFYSTALCVVLIRKEDDICTLSNVNAFASTPFTNGTGGTAYVPYALKATYESATNWSSLESCTFKAIEDNIEELEELGFNVDEFIVTSTHVY